MLSNRLNLSNDKRELCDAVEIDTRKDINYFETLGLYCAENNIDLSEIDDNDFRYCADSIENFAKSNSYMIYDHKIYFSIEN